MPMGGGNNNFAGMDSLNNAWAVLDDSPFPGSAWLFGSALGLLGWVRRRRA
jgi:MYXO-CTERM domain-containing protein